jgi:hypothetical protein
MSKAHLSHANELFFGSDSGSLDTYGRKGIPLHSAYLYSFGLVAAPDADGYATAQAVAAAGNLTLNGALAGVADVARGVVVKSASASDTAQTATFYGTDIHGKPCVETITLTGATAAPGKKAFKTVTRIALSAVTVGNVSAGTTDVLGLPFAAATKSRVQDVWFNDSKDASATIVVADATSPATATTGDPRGTVDPATACDGLKNVTVVMIPDADNAHGVTQYAG